MVDIARKIPALSFPISNLSLTSNIIERVVKSRVTDF